MLPGHRRRIAERKARSAQVARFDRNAAVSLPRNLNAIRNAAGDICSIPIQSMSPPKRCFGPTWLAARARSISPPLRGFLRQHRYAIGGHPSANQLINPSTIGWLELLVRKKAPESHPSFRHQRRMSRQDAKVVRQSPDANFTTLFAQQVPPGVPTNQLDDQEHGAYLNGPLHLIGLLQHLSIVPTM